MAADSTNLRKQPVDTPVVEQPLAQWPVAQPGQLPFTAKPGPPWKQTAAIHQRLGVATEIDLPYELMLTCVHNAREQLTGNGTLPRFIHDFQGRIAGAILRQVFRQ